MLDCTEYLVSNKNSVNPRIMSITVNMEYEKQAQKKKIYSQTFRRVNMDGMNIYKC